MPLGTLWLSFGGPCEPSWKATFGAIPGLDENPEVLHVFDDGSGPALFAGGDLDVAGPIDVNNVAKWDGTEWSDPGGGTNGWVTAMTVFDDGSGSALFVGGAFTMAGGGPANRIAKWDGIAWTALGERHGRVGSRARGVRRRRWARALCRRGLHDGWRYRREWDREMGRLELDGPGSRCDGRGSHCHGGVRRRGRRRAVRGWSLHDGGGRDGGRHRQVGRLHLVQRRRGAGLRRDHAGLRRRRWPRAVRRRVLPPWNHEVRRDHVVRRRKRFSPWVVSTWSCSTMEADPPCTPRPSFHTGS